METVEHIVFECVRAKKIWKLAPIQWDGIKESSGNFKKWWSLVIEARHRLQGMDHIALIVTTHLESKERENV